VRERIASLGDPRLDDYRNITDARLLHERRLFVAEGRLVVRRLIEGGRFPVRSVMVTPTAAGALADLFAPRPTLPVYEVSQDTMNGVTGFDMHRGCLAIGCRTDGVSAEALADVGHRLVALEGVGNADNIGSIFRSAAAFGADGVLLDGATTDPLYRKSLRTSMGAVLDVPFARTADWLATLRHCRRSGKQLIALTPDPGAADLAAVARSIRHQPWLLLLGHEGGGLSPATLAECDVRARIPIQPGVDSLNVGTAAAIALYEVMRARSPASNA
jgi:tRNA G18 (ribose-2'-O)-methylase SpoU